jgi:hypothetical protein
VRGLDANCKRIDYAGVESLTLHNALDDALLVKLCFEKLNTVN